MNRRQFLAASAGLLASLLAACGSGGGPNQDLAQQFLTERNGGTPVAIGIGGPNAPILGSIESIDGRRLTVKPPDDASATAVELADGAKIYKDIDVQLGEVTAGASVVAFGTRQGDVFQADLLRLGGTADMAAGPLVFTSASGSAGATSAGGNDQIIGAPNGAPLQPVSGIVESIADRKIVIKDQAGASTTIALAENGKIQKSAEVTPAELTVGTFVVASGARNGALFQAAQVHIMPAPQDH